MRHKPKYIDLYRYIPYSYIPKDYTKFWVRQYKPDETQSFFAPSLFTFFALRRMVIVVVLSWNLV